MVKPGRPRTAEYRICTCAVCGKEFELAAWKKQSGKFCSNPCWHKAQVGRPIEKLRKSPVEKGCPVCAKRFLVGGAYNTKFHTVYCSRFCSGKAHTKYPAPRELIVAEAAYLAGFLDGEGSIIQAKPHIWRVAIFQSDEGMIRWIAEVTGTGKVASRRMDGKNLVKKSTFKIAWYWQLYGHNAALFVRQLLPYLRVKRPLAETMLHDYPLHVEDGKDYSHD